MAPKFMTYDLFITTISNNSSSLVMHWLLAI